MFNETTETDVLETSVDVTDAGDGANAALATTTADAGATSDADFFGSEGKLDPQAPDAHRAEIVSVTIETAKNTGTQCLAVQFKSLDTGIANNAFKLALWGPADLFDPTSPCWAGGHFDNTKLSKVPPEGKKQSADQAYARNFFNSKKTGTVQMMVAAAAEEGRTPASIGLASPTNPEEYAANLNALLAGTTGILTRRPEKNDNPQFDGQLKPAAFYPASALDSQPGVFAKLRKVWEG